MSFEDAFPPGLALCHISETSDTETAFNWSQNITPSSCELTVPTDDRYIYRHTRFDSWPLRITTLDHTPTTSSVSQQAELANEDSNRASIVLYVRPRHELGRRYSVPFDNFVDHGIRVGTNTGYEYYLTGT